MQGLKDKVFIVTGGGSGIGAATVSRLLAEGARVAAAGTRPEGLARTRAAAGAAADNLLTVQFDLRDEDSIGSLVAQTVDGFGRLDGVANVAAGVVPGLIDQDDGVENLDVDLWAEVLRINLIGTGLVIRESLPAIVAAGGGSIVNVSSAAAWLGETTRPAYGASKIGLHSLTRHTARAWGHENVRCNAVAPGKVLSDKGMTTTPQGYNQAMLDRMCLPRLGQPQDLASMLAFLLSDESSWITGQILSVDGGLMLRE
jgi:NAD(P)-dependent dehydrogenase (short-subunit alcohol dehydrogenase family)